MQPLDPDPLVRGQVRITCTHECNTSSWNLDTSNLRQVLHFFLEPATSGLTPAQIDYVFRHPVAVFEVESRTPGDRVMAILGYVDEFRERRIELLVSQRTRKVFHAMDCREEWRSYFKD